MNRKKSFFIYVVDSQIHEATNQLLSYGPRLKWYENYFVTEPRGAGIILQGLPEDSMINSSERLLVFLSTFGGNIDPTIRLAKTIKKLRSDSIVYLRSANVPTEEIGVDYSVFDGMVEKNDSEGFRAIVQEFTGTPALSS